jgi:hypothetical protein
MIESHIMFDDTKHDCKDVEPVFGGNKKINLFFLDM